MPPARTCWPACRSTFKGQIVGQELTRWPDQLDFSAELSKAREAKPDAIFAFYPGGAGVQFITQYVQAGLKGQIPLYTAFTIDDLSLPRLKDLAVGVPGAQEWVNDLPNDANKKYVADYKAKYHASPSFYGAQTYDAVGLIDSAVTAVKGDLGNKEGMRKEMEKADFKSVRGDFKFGNNHIPIQNFYLQDAVKNADGSLRAQDRRDDRQGRPGQIPRPMPDEVESGAESNCHPERARAQRGPRSDASRGAGPSPCRGSLRSHASGSTDQHALFHRAVTQRHPAWHAAVPAWRPD